MQGQETEQRSRIDIRSVAVKLTDVGQARDHNEDSVAVAIPERETLRAKGSLYLVADGMGGHQAGEVASQRAAGTIVEAYFADGSGDISASLSNAVHKANAVIFRMAQSDVQRAGMGTTAVAAVLRGTEVHVANVGDSRAYLLRDGELIQITKDHSFVQEQIDANIISPEEARNHPKRNVITRALGHKPEVQVDTFLGEMVPDDLLLICSDGLSGVLQDEEILGILNQYPPSEAVIHLVDQANLYGGPDNISVVLVQALPQVPDFPLAMEVAPGAEPTSTTASSGPSDTGDTSSRSAGRLFVMGAMAIVLLAALIVAGLTMSGGGNQKSTSATSLPPSPLATLTVETTSTFAPEGETAATPPVPAAQATEPITPIAPTSTSVELEPTAEVP
jgi:serine/threonine protein phosphatase PrpC